jgi:hypothetical protein
LNTFIVPNEVIFFACLVIHQNWKFLLIWNLNKKQKMSEDSDVSRSNSDDEEKKKIIESLWIPDSSFKQKSSSLSSSSNEGNVLSNSIQRQAQRILER